MLPRNVGNLSPIYATQHGTRAEDLTYTTSKA